MPRWAPPELVSAAIAGDPTAVERLVAAVWPDAAQESCVLIHRRIGALRDAGAFDAWLYRVVMRESSRARRRHRFAPQPYRDALFPDDTIGMDVWRALAELPPDQRDVVVLFYFDDLKSDEIAAVLRVAHPTVRTRLARARERLRGLLDDYSNDPSPTSEEMHHAV